VDGDLSDPEVPARLISETADALGGLDALVNNAGVTLAKPALELTAADFDLIFAVDVRAAFLLSQHAARRMGERGGSIVNVTSVHEHVPRVGFTLYAAAKAALGMLTRSLALELAPAVRVNAVAPGVIATPRNEEAESLGGDSPLGRAGTPAEIAAVVAFVLSDEAAYMTGESVIVDGGALQKVIRPAV
jgi:pteridine reductase